MRHIKKTVNFSTKNSDSKNDCMKAKGDNFANKDIFPNLRPSCPENDVFLAKLI